MVNKYIEIHQKGDIKHCIYTFIQGKILKIDFFGVVNPTQEINQELVLNYMWHYQKKMP